MEFRAEIRLEGLNPYVQVSAARAQRLQRDWRRPMPVTVQVNGQPEPPWRINMMPVGDGSFRLYLAGAVRQASGTQVGDRVVVRLHFDDHYRGGPQHELPAELAAVLDGDAAANARWQALAPSRRKEILRYLAGLKSASARERHIAQTLRVLRGERLRFMARDWN